MHSRIGSSRPLRQYLFAGNPSNDRGNCALHGDGIGLHLPTGKFRSVIGDNHFEIAHAAIFRVAVRSSIIEATESFGSNLPVPGARRNFNRVLVRYTEWFPRNSVSRVGLSPISMSRETPTAGNQGRGRNRRGQGVFLPAFRNLPAILYVPMLEQNFILGSLAVSRT